MPDHGENDFWNNSKWFEMIFETIPHEDDLKFSQNFLFFQFPLGLIFRVDILFVIQLSQQELKLEKRETL